MVKKYSWQVDSDEEEEERKKKLEAENANFIKNFIIFTTSSELNSEVRYHVDEIGCTLRNSGCTQELIDCNNNLMAWPKLLARLPNSVQTKYRHTQIPLPQIFQGEYLTDRNLKYCGGYDEYKKSLVDESLNVYFHTPADTIKVPSLGTRMKAKRDSLALNEEAEASFKAKLENTIREAKTPQVFIYMANEPREVKVMCRDIFSQLTRYDIDYKTIDFTGREKNATLQREYDRMVMSIRLARSKMSRSQVASRNILPQIFYQREYRGGYDEFDNAVRQDQLLEFLDIPGLKKPGSYSSDGEESRSRSPSPVRTPTPPPPPREPTPPPPREPTPPPRTPTESTRKTN